MSNEFFYLDAAGNKADAALHQQLFAGADPAAVALSIRKCAQDALASGTSLPVVKALWGLQRKDKWFDCVEVAGVKLNEPGIYEWKISGIGTYIGKYTRISRPKREYTLNVSRLLSGQPYRRGNPEGFRRIHWLLAGATDPDLNKTITLTILENVAPDRLLQREAELILERGNLNGGVKRLG